MVQLLVLVLYNKIKGTNLVSRALATTVVSPMATPMMGIGGDPTSASCGGCIQPILTR